MAQLSFLVHINKVVIYSTPKIIVASNTTLTMKQPRTQSARTSNEIQTMKQRMHYAKMNPWMWLILSPTRH